MIEHELRNLNNERGGSVYARPAILFTPLPAPPHIRHSGTDIGVHEERGILSLIHI